MKKVIFIHIDQVLIKIFDFSFNYVYACHIEIAVAFLVSYNFQDLLKMTESVIFEIFVLLYFCFDGWCTHDRVRLHIYMSLPLPLPEYLYLQYPNTYDRTYFNAYFYERNARVFSLNEGLVKNWEVKVMLSQNCQKWLSIMNCTASPRECVPRVFSQLWSQ